MYCQKIDSIFRLPGWT